MVCLNELFLRSFEDLEDVEDCRKEFKTFRLKHGQFAPQRNECKSVAWKVYAFAQTTALGMDVTGSAR